MKKNEFYKNFCELSYGAELLSKTIEFLALYLHRHQGKTLLIGYYEPYLPYLKSLENFNYITIEEDSRQQLDLIIVFNYLEYVNNVNSFFKNADNLLIEEGKIIIIYSRNCDLRNYHDFNNANNKAYIRAKNYISFFFKNMFLVNKIHNAAREYLFKINRLETLYKLNSTNKTNNIDNIDKARNFNFDKVNILLENPSLQRFWPFPICCPTFNILELKREIIIPICNYIPI